MDPNLHTSSPFEPKFISVESDAGVSFTTFRSADSPPGTDFADKTPEVFWNRLLGGRYLPVTITHRVPSGQEVLPSLLSKMKKKGKDITYVQWEYQSESIPWHSLWRLKEASFVLSKLHQAFDGDLVSKLVRSLTTFDGTSKDVLNSKELWAPKARKLRAWMLDLVVLSKAISDVQLLAAERAAVDNPELLSSGILQIVRDMTQENTRRAEGFAQKLREASEGENLVFSRPEELKKVLDSVLLIKPNPYSIYTPNTELKEEEEKRWIEKFISRSESTRAAAAKSRLFVVYEPGEETFRRPIKWVERDPMLLNVPAAESEIRISEV